MQDTTKILIADDHQILLDGIVSLLRSEPGFEIIATATNGYEVMDKLDRERADVCLLDISMPMMDGLATAKLIREKIPETRIIILTTYNDKEIITQMLQVGVSGYILKNSSSKELVAAVKKVAAGGVYFSDEVHAGIMQDYLHQLEKDRGEKGTVVLTERETEVLQLLAREYTNETIAAELNISYRTVETHRKNIMQKTKSHNLAGLLRFAYSKGFIK